MFPIKWFDTYCQLKDGVRLISRVWRPQGDGPWPALLMRQPYGREIASTITYAHPTWWASKGYLVIIQDVRGTGESEGVFHGFKQEPNDSSETHEWVRSLPECNGFLGLYGFSYQGLTQLTGNKNSRLPDCLSPAMTGLDIKNHWSSDGDAFWWFNNITWALQLAALKMKKENNKIGWEIIRSSIENNIHLKDGLEILKKYDPENFIIKWLDIINGNKEFEKIEPTPSLLKKPMLILGGLWDPHLKGALDLYKKSKLCGGNPELIIGNATHLNWWKGSQNTLLKFFDNNLKGKKQVISSPIKKIWNISQSKWEDIDQLKSCNFEFSLKSEGLANVETKEGSLVINSKGSGFVSIVHDPWRPTPSQGGHLGPNPGIFNRSMIDERLDVAVFQTSPLDEIINLSGTPKFQTSLFSDSESFDICLALSLINQKDKSVKQFSTGFLRVNNSQIQREKNLTVFLQPTNITIFKGEIIRLSIAGAAWPAIGVNSGYKSKTPGKTSINHKVITLNFNLKDTIMKIDPFF